MRQTVSLSLVVLLAIWAGSVRADDAEIEFFEQKIRPVLVEHCYACHSTKAEELKGELRLDTREGLLQGGDSGPAIVPGRPDASLLLAALRYEGPEMPPQGKLPEAVIADFETWIARGATDPRQAAKAAAPGAAVDPFEQGKTHWAYQPLRLPPAPAVKDPSWPASPLDRFVLARLEAADLAPAPPADRRTLLRRVYYDLLGLPPTWEEAAAFADDPSPDAYERVVDRLLASPQYGERWGRHWLDVARYADTKDLVLVYGDDAIRPYAYTYRDYVIRALNADTPYDRFIHEQLAAEQLDPPVEPWRLAAMGFLTLGRLYDNNPPDIYDDQIDVVTRGLLGLTVSCARCHDHKYDAIPTEDYYSLYGVFANSQRPIDPPRIDERGGTAAAEFEAKAAPKREALVKLIDEQYREINATARRRTADYLTKIAVEKPDPLETAVFYLSLSPEDLKPQLLASWRRYLEKRAAPDDPVFGPWSELLAIAEEDFSSQSAKVVERWSAKEPGLAAGQINSRLKQALRETTLTGRGDVAALYGKLLTQAAEEAEQAAGASSPAASDASADSEHAARNQLAAVLTAEDGPLFFPKSHAFLYMPRVERGNYENLLQELDKLAVADPHAPPRAMTLADSEQVREPHVYVRGNPRQPGDQVPRRFLKVLSGEPRQPFAHGAGRLDLARAITAPENPLTARVMVNRVWMHHFGEPLVSTPSDFGARSDPPTHPELLDYLAWTFQKKGWSLKRLHRMIVLSSTYRQSTSAERGARSAEQSSAPRSALRVPRSALHFVARRRLDLEAMRDTLLTISNRLDGALYGRPVDAAGDAFNRRRTIYGLVDRQNLPGLYRAFDFANPDQSADRRPNTTTPQQALFGLNSPFLIEQAKGIAGRREVHAGPATEDRIRALYRLVFARDPSDAEIAAGARFLDAAANGKSELSPWEQYAQVLLLTNELVFID
jgi:hypothetical protein